MSFAVRASTNSLATPDNIARWGKVVDPHCKVCLVEGQPGNRVVGTLGHVLNSCSKMLDRYEWRHNGVLCYLYNTLRDAKLPGFTVYADLEGAQVSRPDLVFARQVRVETQWCLVLSVQHTEGCQVAWVHCICRSGGCSGGWWNSSTKHSSNFVKT